MNDERLYKILLGPHISEKATIAAEVNRQMVFKVAKSATKREIKLAVEKLFNVKVEQVKTLLVKGKLKRNRYGDAKKSDWKKAYVSLAEGHDIDLELAD